MRLSDLALSFNEALALYVLHPELDCSTYWDAQTLQQDILQFMQHRFIKAYAIQLLKQVLNQSNSDVRT